MGRPAPRREDRGMAFAPERIMSRPAIRAILPHAIPAPPRAQRVDGALRLVYRHDGARGSQIADLYQRAPCRVLFPCVEPEEPPQAVLLTTSGGLTGGDRLQIEVEVREGARATLSTQAAEKIYRAADDDEDARIDIALRVGTGAYLEWFGQETILFDRARLRRRLHATLDAGARLLAVESLIFGRRAMREDYRSGRLHDVWHIHCENRLAWADALHLSGDIAAQRAQPFGFGTACGCATLVYVGDDAAEQRERLRAHADDGAEVGATLVHGVLVVRVLADDAQRLRHAVMRVAAGLRAAGAGLPARLPRVWDC